MRKIRIFVSLAMAVVLAPMAFAQDAQSKAPAAATAQTKRPMTFEDMMKMKRLGETAVSPDGKWLAYSVTTVDLEQNTKTPELWLQAIAPPDGGGPNSKSPMKIAVAQPHDSGVQFAPDGKRILFLSGRGGSEQVWIADFDAVTVATANAKKLTAISTEAGDAIWSPDGNSILFTSAVYPDCPAMTAADFATGDKCNAERDAAAAASKVKAQIFTHLLYRHWDHFTGEKRTHLFLAAVGTGAVRDLTPNDAHDVPPFSLEGGGCGCAFAPDGKELAFTENLDPEPAISTSPSIFTLDLTSPAAKPVKVSTSKGGNFNPAYSPDGKWLAWRSQERAGYESDRFRLMIYDRAKSSKSASQRVSESAVRDLMPEFDRWVDEFAWGPTNSGVIYFTAEDTGEQPVYAMNIFNGHSALRVPIVLASEEAIDITKTKPLGRNLLGEYINLHPTPDGKLLIATRMTVRAPGEIVGIDSRKVGHVYFTVLLEPQDIEIPQFIHESQLTHFNDSLLAQLDLPEMESFWFTARDGTKLQGFLIRPPGFDAQKKYPVKFLIHGGPQGAWGDDWSYRWNAELFAANGYVVVMVNMRGSTGYGQAIVMG
jgi:dipeptidyl aminopeptidase/acylaminoacyl peptidase